MNEKGNDRSAEKKDVDSLYLQKLMYRASDFSSILKDYVSNMRIVALVLIFLIFGGGVAFVSVPRTLNPEINLAIIAVTTALPGSTPTDVESLITKKIEKEIAKVDGVDVITSTSREGVSNVIVQFQEGTKRDVAQTNVQNAVNAVANLPQDATNPQVKAFDFEDIPIISYAVAAREIDPASLDSLVTSLVNDLEEQQLIDRVVVTGNEKQEVQILITQERLQELGIDIRSVAALVTSSTASYPAGVVQSGSSTIGLTIDRDNMTLEDLRALNIDINGNAYRLGDIAEISERSAPGFTPSFLTESDGKEQVAVTLSVYRIIGAKISDAYEQVDRVVAEYQEISGDRVQFTTVLDIHQEIQKSFNDLYKNLFATVLLVFIVLFLFVGVRQAFLAAVSVPLVFMATFIVMMMTGMTLNFLSIFSLLLSLGLLVDVTIVVISAITTYHRTGKFAPHEAALLVWKDYFFTLLVTTLTTVWAFLPLLLASGIMGEFLKPLPIVVSSALIGSVLIGFFVILPLMVWLLDFSIPQRVRIFLGGIFVIIFAICIRGLFSLMQIYIAPILWIIVIPVAIIGVLAGFRMGRVLWQRITETCKKRFCIFYRIVNLCTQSGIINISNIADLYRRILGRMIEQKTKRRLIVVMVVIFFVFSVSLVALGFVKNEFFPSNDANVLYVSIELPLDTRSEVAEAVARDFVKKIVGFEGVKNMQTQIGAKFSGDGEVTLGMAANNFLITINLYDEDERHITSMDIAEKLRRSEFVHSFHEGVVTVSEQGSGPPSGADVTVKLTGDDLDVLNVYADQIMQKLEMTQGVINVQKSVRPGSAKIVFVPDHEQMTRYGFTINEIGAYLRTFGSGYVVEENVEFSDLSEDRDIVIRLSKDLQEISALDGAMISSAQGAFIPIASLGSFVMKESPISIEREDQRRVLSVTASVVEGYNANMINQEIGRYIDNDVRLGQGYQWQTGGANEENQKSVNSILQAMILAFILIFLTLIVQLKSYRKSFIVLLVIPLAISGVFVLFAIFGIPLSFPALIGILALFGIVINNSIMIVDQINKNHEAKIPFHQAIVEGSASRLEPILLSSLTTIVGLAPITITQPLWQGLGGAIISGLTFSGLIMLFFIPAVYYMMMEKDYC